MAKIYSTRSIFSESLTRYKITLEAPFEGFIILQDRKRMIEYTIFPSPDEWKMMEKWNDKQWEENLAKMEGWKDV